MASKKKIRGYKTIHTFPKKIEDKTNDDNNKNINNDNNNNKNINNVNNNNNNNTTTTIIIIMKPKQGKLNRRTQSKKGDKRPPKKE